MSIKCYISINSLQNLPQCSSLDNHITCKLKNNWFFRDHKINRGDKEKFKGKGSVRKNNEGWRKARMVH